MDSVHPNNERLLPVKQTDITDCGVACVKYILSYYNITEDLYRIKLYHLFKFGFYSFQDLSNIFEKYNLNATGYFIDMDLLFTLNKPILAHLSKYGVLNHFVVIEKTSGSNVYYMDPSFGKTIKSDKSKFSLLWSGKILLITKEINYVHTIEKKSHQKIFAFVINKRTTIAVFAISIFLLMLLFFIIEIAQSATQH